MNTPASKSDIDPKKNQILAALPKADYQRLLPHLTSVPLPLGWTMSESGDHVRYVHFPTDGIVSLVYRLEDGSSSEVALVGNEGIVGISIFMGGESMPTFTTVQNAGHAFRLDRATMKREFELGGELQKLSLLYTQALISQTAQTAVCNQHHSIEQQLSRWLLMSTDYLQNNDLTVTQELMAAGTLQRAGLLTVRRGHITVLDRKKMEQHSCECYETVKGEYARLLPQPSTVD